jgi:hypothetical protein
MFFLLGDIFSRTWLMVAIGFATKNPRKRTPQPLLHHDASSKDLGGKAGPGLYNAPSSWKYGCHSDTPVNETFWTLSLSPLLWIQELDILRMWREERNC